MKQGAIRYLNDEKKDNLLIVTSCSNEITEHSQKVGRLYGKVWKGCTAGRLTAHGIDKSSYVRLSP
jgi:hypothetical protein